MSREAYQRMLDDADQLYSRAEVSRAIDRVAAALAEDVADQDPVLLCVMNGGIVFAGELLTRLPFRLQLDHVHASRYRGALRGGELDWSHQPATPLSGRCVVLLDDILDEGDTLAGIRKWCLEQGGDRVVTAVLVDKQHDRRCPELPRADHTALYVEDRYLFGFGMDCREYWRNAPGIFAIRGGG